MEAEFTKTGVTYRRSHMRSIVGWFVSIGCLALIAWKVDLVGAASALSNFSWPFLLLAFSGLAFGYAIRIIRWALMLRATGALVSSWQCATPFLGSIALNNVLPLRAGDIVRATVFPLAIGVPRSAAISSIIVERLLDLLTLALCLAVGATTISGVRLPQWLVDGTILMTTAGMLALFAIFFFSRAVTRLLIKQADLRHPDDAIARGLRAGAAFFEGFQHISAPRPLTIVFALSLLVWAGEAAAFYFIIAGFGIQLSMEAALLVMAFVTLSTLVPSSPGYVGPFHLAAISVMVLLGTPKEIATSFAVLSHLTLWMPTTVAGGIAMLLKPEIFRAARSMQSPIVRKKVVHEQPSV